MAFAHERPSCSSSQSGGSQSGLGSCRTVVYRTYLDELKDIHHETMRPDICISKVNRVIEEMEGLEDLETPPTSAEMCLDLHVTNMTGKVIKEQCLVSTANTRQVFDEAEFIQVLRDKFLRADGDELDFPAIGLIGRAMLKPVSGCMSRMGRLSVEAKELPQKERKAREARKKDEVTAEVKAPKKLEQAPEKTEDGIDEIVIRIVKALKRVWTDNNKQPVSYFNFVLHPTNFAKTVQNMFHVSFAVKDGWVEMDVGKEGYPTITPKRKDKDKKTTDEVAKLPKKQMITSLSVKEWKELVKVFDVTRAVLD